MKKTVIILLTALLTIPFTDASAQILKKRQSLEALQRQVDSLQQAYDSLMVEYQALSDTDSDDDDILVDEEIAPLLDIEYNSDNIDSLLNMYYIQKQLDANVLDIENLELDSLTSNIPDAVYIERLKKMNSFIPVEFNKAVKNSIIRYTDRIPNTTARILGLAPYYLPEIEEIMDEFGLPKELKAMAIIESAFNPRAVSRARAKGMWQFMYATGKRYGLEMTSFVDERFDPVASCRAAAQYLKDSYRVFGDWSLAIASYNCGPGNVSKAIRRSGGKTDFWEIYQYLPRETRGYVPAFIAALYVLNYHKEHGIVPAQISRPASIDTFHIDRTVHFQQISDLAGIPMETLRDLNPQYLHDIVPGNEHTYVLNIPSQYTLAFIDVQDSIYAYKDSVFLNEVTIKKIQSSGSDSGNQRIIHKVKSGETLSSIARKHHTTVNNIKKWNKLKSNTIRVGQRLSIYSNAGGGSVSSSSAGTVSSASASKSTASSGPTTYTVRKGDTLSKIATKTGVSLSKLYKLNNLNSHSKIYPGMKIKIKAAQ